jgi:PAS domain-containing protein
MRSTRRDSERDRLNLALSSAEMGTWDLDVPAAVIWWDERMHSLFGLAPGAFTGNYKDFLGLLHEEDQEKVRGEFIRALRHAPGWTQSFG